MSAGPIYAAGFKAGVAAAEAYLDGRASMARELGRPGEAEALDMARPGLLRLVATPEGREEGDA